MTTLSLLKLSSLSSDKWLWDMACTWVYVNWVGDRPVSSTRLKLVTADMYLIHFATLEDVRNKIVPVRCILNWFLFIHYRCHWFGNEFVWIQKNGLLKRSMRIVASRKERRGKMLGRHKVGSDLGNLDLGKEEIWGNSVGRKLKRKLLDLLHFLWLLPSDLSSMDQSQGTVDHSALDQFTGSFQRTCSQQKHGIIIYLD